MAAIRVPRRYWTLPELAAKWRLPAQSPDLQRLVMDGILKPCLMLATELHPVQVQEGQATVIREHLEPVQGQWLYPVYPRQVGPFDCLYECVADMALPVEGSTLWGLQEPMTLADVMRLSVVMADDVAAAETILKPDADEELSEKQERTRDKLLVTMAFELYGWDPASERSQGITELVNAARASGLSVSFNAAKTHLRLAWDRCTPRLG